MMIDTRLLCALLLSTLTAPGLARAAELGARLDAEVTTSAGKKTQLKAYYGKPVLLFYEDPSSVKLNLAAKEKLGKLALKWKLKDKVDIVAVANLQGLNWQPALFISLLVVRGEEEKAKIPVLVDFNGSMARAPWKLQASSSTILVLAPDGEVLFQSIGVVTPDKFTELCATLERLLTTETTAQAPRATEADAVAMKGTP